MMNQIVLISLSAILLTSCATKQIKTSSADNNDVDYKPSVSEQAEYYRVQEELIESDLPNCSGCIHGSAHEKTFEPQTVVYELDERAKRELNLKNTKFDIPVVWNRHILRWPSLDFKIMLDLGQKQWAHGSSCLGLERIMALASTGISMREEIL